VTDFVVGQVLDHPDTQILNRKFRFKYIYDPIFACLILLLVWPVFLLVALLIKFGGLKNPKERGAVFYTEPRITAGKVFYLIKFRTATEEAVRQIKSDSERSSMTGSAEITWAGKIILNWYLDEVPQLINIAKGEMSFVGLRPHIIQQTREEIEAEFPYRMMVKAGFFGVPQACKKDPKYQNILERMARMHRPLRVILFKLDGLYVEKCKIKSPLEILFFDLYLTMRCFLVIARGGGS